MIILQWYRPFREEINCGLVPVLRVVSRHSSRVSARVRSIIDHWIWWRLRKRQRVLWGSQSSRSRRGKGRKRSRRCRCRLGRLGVVWVGCRRPEMVVCSLRCAQPWVPPGGLSSSCCNRLIIPGIRVMWRHQTRLDVAKLEFFYIWTNRGPILHSQNSKARLF